MNQQILFSSDDQAQQTFDNFYPAENQHLLAALTQFIQPSTQFSCMYIYGQSGSGKTHVLNSVINSLGDESRLVDLNFQQDQLGEIINLTELNILVVDNFENLTGHESEMMLIYETLKQHAGKLLIAASVSPKTLNLKLNDLTSRLLSGEVFELKLLNDEDKINALKYRAKLRGFELTEEVVNYVINRYPRDFKTLFGLLDKFDDASLSSQRKLTVPFVKQIEDEAIEI